ncbi:energy-coupling factor transporter transmembrane protein EcfT [Enterococcus sp. BWB1-3]|nr:MULTISPECIES: energy-coupling factor transporter transmembrane component T [unclassified Enterococcus]MBL1230613.1 energy-coupling factor transporter transmembrane protein EcfT [Enterococcus sp. BWB1-3]MCB5950921.1 energy-coupling factor transporter transmembrane protein EcfT [Enterococcus sp. BWT-B8]MCB5955559.1 energy-coupling factor transporter transmembrane protein EcfT [Enterococcus sp. CWB-B31]
MKGSIDPKIQFLILIAQSILVLAANVNQLILLNIFGLFYLIYNGFFKTAAKIAVLVSITIGLHLYIVTAEQQWLKYIGFFSFMFLRFGPVLMIARVLQDVPAGRLMSALQSLKLPKNFSVTLAVVLRFFPTIRQENSIIQLSAKLRGLSFSQPKNWLHPLKTFEHTFVPLMMRTMKITDELTVSAMTKGIEYPGQRTSIYQSRITIKDLSMVLFFIGYVFNVFVFKVWRL